MSKQKNAISPTREEDFPEWYQEVIKAADLAENSQVRGCMVIKPWGFGIWERIQRYLDDEIKRTGHDNVYFPLFIPLSFMEKEAKHVSGFAKECAIVTHHRLEEKEGNLVPAGELAEPLIIRPTSEMIIGDSFSRWVESWRDLPLKVNQWANIVRWEMRPRIFLRTAEFLWQEGHTAHATKDEAVEEAKEMLDVYRDVYENRLALPVIPGKKSPDEKFPGADTTYTLEVMMQDRKALQGCTSHYLGQHFSKAQGIKFNNKDEVEEYAYTTSWGLTTRTVGGMIMVHGDDDGLRVPPKVAHKQVVILPVIPNDDVRDQVLEYADQLKKMIEALSWGQEKITAFVDVRDKRGGEKTWEWIKKGVPVRLEVGPKDIEKGQVVLCRRDKGPKEKEFLNKDKAVNMLPSILDEIQATLFNQAKEHLEKHTYDHLTSMDELIAFFTPKNKNKPEIHGGFVKTKWCEEPGLEEALKEHNLAIRCIPLEQSGTEGKCIFSGKPAKTDIIIAKSY